ncbi:hypothetical protein OIU76_027209 [Salix suchowensis]|nr:hypothetical protein OIU76_027209 [Salix suchowensis]
MSTVEMEVFSNSQLIVLIILMLIGGEIFTSMVGLLFKKFQLKRMENKISSLADSDPSTCQSSELEMVEKRDFESLESGNHETSLDSSVDLLKCKSIKFLWFVVLGYFIAVQVLGVSLVSTYLALVSSARNVLENKGLNSLTFSIFTTVSTFANCGFLPTNENMVVFQEQLRPPTHPHPSDSSWKHPIPFLPEILCLVPGKVFQETGLHGLNSYQKIIGALFQTMNTRYAGESIVDLSALSSALLVLFVVMMFRMRYLPPYTSFLPVKDDEEVYKKKRNRRERLLENILFSQLSYLALFTILVCITERQKLEEDPLNFNVLNIVVEVVSAYGSVGFTTGYSCDRQTQPDSKLREQILWILWEME